MSARFPARLLIPTLVVVLSACGETAAPPTAILTPDVSQTTPAIVPTDTLPPTDVVGPAMTSTIAPSAPMPGLVYTDLVPDKGMAGPWLVEADGQSKQLSDKPSPVLSPDRSQLLYSNYGDIWLLDFATGKTRNLTKTGDRIESFYQWWPAHPDLIVFHYQPADDAGPSAGYLATVKPDGTNYLNLDEEARSYSPAALSPDGQSIAYDRGGEPWVYNYSAGKMPIFPKSFQEEFHLAVNPVWSPDSRKIAWQLFGLSGGTDGSSAAAILDLDTMTVSLLHRYPILAGSGLGIDHLAWSPDGKWVAVANQAELAEDRKISLWVMSPDGSEEHHIGAGDIPIWSPDGAALVYTAESGVFAVKAGDWNSFQVTLPETAQVIGWVKV